MSGRQLRLLHWLAFSELVERCRETKVIALDLATGPYDLSSNIKDRSGDFLCDVSTNALDLTCKGRRVAVPNGVIKSFLHADTEPGKIATKFVLFNNLPLEIQAEIWDISIYQNCKPRCMKVCEYEVKSDMNHPAFVSISDDKMANYYTPPLRAPPIVRLVSKEVTKIARLKGIYIPLWIMTSQKAVFFSPKIDVFRLTTTSKDPLLALDEVIDTKVLAQIKNVQLPARHMKDSHAEWFEKNLKFMEQLTNLHIEGGLPIARGFTAPAFIHFCYEKNRYSQKWEAAILVGGHLRGEAAYEVLFRLITDPSCHSWFRKVDAMLNLWARNIKGFPTVVGVILYFFPMVADD